MFKKCFYQGGFTDCLGPVTATALKRLFPEVCFEPFFESYCKNNGYKPNRESDSLFGLYCCIELIINKLVIHASGLHIQLTLYEKNVQFSLPNRY
jgi:hypothetical protein